MLRSREPWAYTGVDGGEFNATYLGCANPDNDPQVRGRKGRGGEGSGGTGRTIIQSLPNQAGGRGRPCACSAPSTRTHFFRSVPGNLRAPLASHSACGLAAPRVGALLQGSWCRLQAGFTGLLGRTWDYCGPVCDPAGGSSTGSSTTGPNSAANCESSQVREWLGGSGALHVSFQQQSQLLHRHILPTVR